MKKTISALFFLFLLFPFSAEAVAAPEKAEKWTGIDETVIEKFSGERGRPASEPLINTDQGDLLLFLFLLAGFAGGFAAGYFWRFIARPPKGEDSR